MKKMMVLVAAIALAFASQAATFKWTASNIFGADGNKFAGEVTLMAYLDTATAADAFVATTFTPTTAGVVNKTFTNDDLVGGKTYNFYIVAEQTVNDTLYTFTSALKPAQAQATSTPTLGFGNMQSATTAQGAWSSVPEPTSGLLLLLGMAGIALKRKVA